MALFFQIPNREPAPCPNLRPTATVSPNRLRSVKSASLKIGFVFQIPSGRSPTTQNRNLASFLKPSSAPLIWLRSVNCPSPIPKPAIGFVFEKPPRGA
jgi:hypothetical protein